MGPNLSCFDWSNTASSYLDGSLSPSLQRIADEHLDACKECRDRHQRYRQIVDSLQGLQRVPAPAKIKYEREPQEPGLKNKPRTTYSRLDRYSRPVTKYLRSLNARSWAWITVSVLGFVILTSLPKLRAFYEARLQKKLDAVNYAELPITQDPKAALDASSGETIHDDFGGEEGEEGDSESGEGASGSLEPTSWEGEWNSNSAPKGSSPDRASDRSNASSQVWRFTLRTDSPQDLRLKIQEILLHAGASPSAKMIHGFVAPGGIQFDVLVPAESIPSVQDTLERLSKEHSPPEDMAGGESPYPTQPFTWYRNRSKRPLPAGAARVVIWLSLS